MPQRTARFTDSAARAWQLTFLPKSRATLTASLDLIFAHHGQAAMGCRAQVVAGDIELDVVHAFAAAQANGLPDLLRAVGNQAKAFVIHVRFALVAQTAGDGDLRACRTNTRTGKLSRIDGIPNDNIETQL